MSWAHAPGAGRRACRWSSPIAGTSRMARPRSAVTVWPSAPALARLTGFSRSGKARDSLAAPATPGSATSASRPSLGLAASCGHPVYDRCTLCVRTRMGRPSVSTGSSAAGIQIWKPGGFSVLPRSSRSSAFHAPKGRLAGPGHRSSEVAWEAARTSAPKVAGRKGGVAEAVR